MANEIALITKYAPEILDEIFAKSAVTTILEGSSALMKFTNAKTVMLPDTTMDGLGDYSRENGFPAGDVDVVWEPYTLRKDRAKTFSIDNMDNEETAGIAYGELQGEFMRTRVIPEVDAYRLSTLFANAKDTNITAKTIAANTIIGEFNTMIKHFLDHEIETEEAVFFVSTAVDKLLKETTELNRQITQVDYKTASGITFKLSAYQGIPIIVVPIKRFKTSYSFGTNGFTPTVVAYALTEDVALKTGKDYYTRSGSAGAYTYTKVATPDVGDIATYYEVVTPAGKDMSVMLVHKRAALPVKKHAKIRTFLPDDNQTKDAYKFDYRLYHDIFSPKNKTDGICVITVLD